MGRNKKLQETRDEKIRKRYAILASKKMEVKQLYRHDAILEMLTKEFFLAEKYIERIVSKNY